MYLHYTLTNILHCFSPKELSNMIVSNNYVDCFWLFMIKSKLVYCFPVEGLPMILGRFTIPMRDLPTVRVIADVKYVILYSNTISRPLYLRNNLLSYICCSIKSTSDIRLVKFERSQTKIVL